MHKKRMLFWGCCLPRFGNSALFTTSAVLYLCIELLSWLLDSRHDQNILSCSEFLFSFLASMLLMIEVYYTAEHLVVSVRGYMTYFKISMQMALYLVNIFMHGPLHFTSSYFKIQRHMDLTWTWSLKAWSNSFCSK